MHGNAKIDLAGKRIGHLKVLRVTEGRDPIGQLLWECVCDCGNTFTCAGGPLRQGVRVSCGCAQFSEETKTKRRKAIRKTCGTAKVERRIDEILTGEDQPDAGLWD